MKKLNLDKIKLYLSKIRDKELYAYGVYQIEAGGRFLFSKIEGDEDTIMGLPVKKIKEYLKIYNEKIFSYRKSDKTFSITKTSELLD